MPDLSPPIKFGEWLPDQGAFNNPGSLIARNVTTQGEIYKPFATLAENTEALPGKCKGGFTYRDASGNVTIFAGTDTGLYKLDGLSWVEVTRLDGAGPAVDPYTTSEDGFWDFLNFGTLVIATNYNDDIQVFDMASSTEFEELSPTAPRCRRFFILSNFLVCVDVVDGDGATGYRVRWSPLGDPRGDWTSDPTGTQADFQDIYGGDFSNSFGAALQDVGVIVQGNALRRMDYVGGDTVFNITPIEGGRGSILPRACISNGDSIYYISQDGFYEYSTAGGNIPIGHGKVDKYFYQNFDEVFDYNANVTVDPIKKLILWSVPYHDADDGLPNKIVAFNWVDRRFTEIDQETEFLFNFLSIGFTIDNMDTLYPNLDTIPFSLDSRIWTGGKTILGGFSKNHKLAAFTGDPQDAKIGTPEVRLNDSSRTTLHNLLAYVEGGSHSARIGSRNLLNQAVLWTPYVNQNSMTGEIDVMKDATYHRAEFVLTGEWSAAHSIAVRAVPSGIA